MQGPRTIVAVAGDWHGDVLWMRAFVDAAAAAGVSLILHVGDLGVLWPGRDKGKFERSLQDRLELRGLQFVFIDGNHDNHHDLRALPLDGDGLGVLRPRVRYLPRGGRFKYAGLKMAGVGGAHSVDRSWRTEGKDWWPEEDVTQGDIETLLAGDGVDILLTHEVPAGVPVRSTLQLPRLDRASSVRTRSRLRDAVDALQPANVFSGHWHQRITSTITHASGAETRVDVLNMEGSRQGNGVLLRRGGNALEVEPLTVFA